MSEPPPATITKPELLDAAAALTPPVTATMLRRWMRAGLMPRAEQEHVVGQRGSVSRYPAHAIALVAEVARRHERQHRLKALLIGLFFDGWPVDTAAARAAMCTVLESISIEVRATIATAGNADDAAEFLARSPSSRARSPSVKLLARRLGGGRELQELMYLLGLVGLGGDVGWDVASDDGARSPTQTLTAAFGLDRAHRDPEGAPWFGDGLDAHTIAEQLAVLGGLDLRDLAGPLREADDEQLKEARDWARLLAEDAPIQGRVMKLSEASTGAASEP